jgi:hypothetical protein
MIICFWLFLPGTEIAFSFLPNHEAPKTHQKCVPHPPSIPIFIFGQNKSQCQQFLALFFAILFFFAYHFWPILPKRARATPKIVAFQFQPLDGCHLLIRATPLPHFNCRIILSKIQSNFQPIKNSNYSHFEFNRPSQNQRKCSQSN